MPDLDIVVKRTEPIRIAEAVGTAPGFGTANIGPVFMKLVSDVLAHLERNNATPGINVGYYEDPAADGTIGVHVGFEIGDQYVDDGGDVRVTELPVIDVASVVHLGAIDGIEADYVALFRWIEGSGYRQAGYSRELYLEWDADDPSRNVTELQMPITR
jgi:effector-binding domain-containing protein